jgi:hypothetical protein
VRQVFAACAIGNASERQRVSHANGARARPSASAVRVGRSEPPASDPYFPFAVAKDGQQFLIQGPPSGAPADLKPAIVVALNWAAGLRQ